MVAILSNEVEITGMGGRGWDVAATGLGSNWDH